jgi:ATP-dependent RNA helicase DeaD
MGPGLALSARSAPKTGIVICYDLPAATELASLGTAGELVLLVPPGGEQYVARVATHRRPMQLRSAAAAVAGRDGALRQQIATSIEAGMNVAALYALAPLFEEHDPQEVAAAVFTLWREAAANRAPAAQPAAIAVTPAREMPSPESGNPAVAKIWIGAGKKDDATVADFVAVLVREVGVDRGRIGRIELRDTFALVEVPAADAAAIVHRLSGITIRKRKLTARVDQGRGGGTPKRR